MGRFFFATSPAADWEELNEQMFLLLYLVPGITDTGLDLMSRDRRVWMINRLAKQKKMEADAMKRGNKKGVKK